MKEISGIEASLTEDDVQDYMSVVMNQTQDRWEIMMILIFELISIIKKLIGSNRIYQFMVF